MEKIVIFYFGVVAGMWAMYSLNSSKPYYSKYREIYKKHKDISNWLKSELSSLTKVKMDKNIDKNKVKLLELLIKKLNGDK